MRNPKIGGLAPIVVVNEIYAAGDGNRAVQTAAFNLPNDERVVREKGAKRVMLKNVRTRSSPRRWCRFRKWRSLRRTRSCCRSTPSSPTSSSTS
jgi:hypothetical protein